jgi:hypothetical protein
MLLRNDSIFIESRSSSPSYLWKSLMMNSQLTILSPPLLSAMVLPLPFGSITG